MPLDAGRRRTLDDLVDGQAGVVSLEQLRQHAFPRGVLRAHLDAGRWLRLHRGVYVTFTGPLPFASRLWAALLRAGPGATAGHGTAAYLDGLADQPGNVLRISIPATRRIAPRLPGIRITVSRRLESARHPARTPPRTRIEETVLDLVEDADSVEAVATWVTRACQRRLTTPRRLAAALARRPRMRWRAEVEAMVADVAEGALSPLEVRHLRRVERAHGLPSGRKNRRRADGRVIWVDIDVDEYSTRIELDGRVGHVAEGAFRDRRRDNAGTVARLATLRYGYAEVFDDPCGIAGQEAAVFSCRGWTGRPRRCGPTCSLLTPP